MQGKFFMRQLMVQVLRVELLTGAIVPRAERHLPVRRLPASQRC